MAPPTETTAQTDQTQDGQQQDQPVDEDLFEVGADLLAKADYAPELVAQVRDSYDYSETFTDRRLRIIGELDPSIADRIQKAIEAEAADKKTDQAREEEVARLDALDAQQRADAMAVLRDQATAEAHDAEIDAFLASRGISKARALADVLSSRETSPSEALAAWDAASEVEREIATTQFGVGVIDFDPNPTEETSS
jgi:hypothetical protein